MAEGLLPDHIDREWGRNNPNPPGNYFYDDLEAAYDYRDNVIGNGNYRTYKVDLTGIPYFPDPENDRYDDLSEGDEGRIYTEEHIPPERISLVDPGLEKIVDRDPRRYRSSMMSAISSQYPDWVWQGGQCGTYALALQEMYPHLRFGVAGEGQAADPHEPHEPYEGWWPQHFFAHDDTHAYDSLGKRPLDEINNRWDVVELDQDPQDWGVPEDEAGPEGVEPGLMAAQEHWRRNHA